MTWPFGSLPFLYLQLRRLLKDPWFDWIANLRTGVFLSIWPNAKSPCFWWTTTFLEVIFARFFFTSKLEFSLKIKFPLALGTYLVLLQLHGVSPRSPYLFCIKLFFASFSLMFHPDGFLFSLLLSWNSCTDCAVIPLTTNSWPLLSSVLFFLFPLSFLLSFPLLKNFASTHPFILLPARFLLTLTLLLGLHLLLGGELVLSQSNSKMTKFPLKTAMPFFTAFRAPSVCGNSKLLVLLVAGVCNVSEADVTTVHSQMQIMINK